MRFFLGHPVYCNMLFAEDKRMIIANNSVENATYKYAVSTFMQI